MYFTIQLRDGWHSAEDELRANGVNKFESFTVEESNGGVVMRIYVNVWWISRLSHSLGQVQGGASCISTSSISIQGVEAIHSVEAGDPRHQTVAVFGEDAG